MDNPVLGRKVLDHITKNPEQFLMCIWGTRDEKCGTVACLAGWSMLFSGYTLNEQDEFVRPGESPAVSDHVAEAASLLGLTDSELSGGEYEPMLFVASRDSAIARFTAMVEAAEAAAA